MGVRWGIGRRSSSSAAVVGRGRSEREELVASKGTSIYWVGEQLRLMLNNGLEHKPIELAGRLGIS